MSQKNLDSSILESNQQSLSELQAVIRRFCDDRDWDQFHNPKDLSISLALEAAEVLEHFQWKDKDEMAKHSIENKDAIAEELADVFYWVLLISNKLDINLVGAFQDKMKKNENKYPIDKAKGSHKKYTELK